MPRTTIEKSHQFRLTAPHVLLYKSGTDNAQVKLFIPYVGEYGKWHDVSVKVAQEIMRSLNSVMEHYKTILAGDYVQLTWWQRVKRQLGLKWR